MLLKRPVRELNPPFRLEGPASYTDRRTSHGSVRRAGVEPAHPKGGCFTGSWAHRCPADAWFSGGAGESRTRSHQGLSLAALPCLRTAPCSSKAPSTGFGPAISCVTGRRALLAAPRGHVHVSVAQVGVEPTASFVLSEGGLPVAYRAAVPRAGVEPANARV